MLKPLTLALTLATTPLTAETEEPHICSVMGESAQHIMTLRQDGFPLSDLMRIFEDDDLIKSMIVHAYNQPRYKSEEYKQEAVEDFRNEIEFICFNS